MEKLEKPKKRFFFFKSKAGDRVNRSLSGDVGVFVFLIIFAVIMALPLYYACLLYTSSCV